MQKIIDQIPLEWCFGDGVVLDFHHKKKGEGISSEEVKQSLDKIGYNLKPFGFKVAAFPINIEAASGAWVRAGAILREQ